MLHEEITSKGVKRTVVMLMADDLRQELASFSSGYEVRVTEWGSWPCVMVTGDHPEMITCAALESCQDVIRCYKLKYHGIGYMVTMTVTEEGEEKRYIPSIVIYFM